MERLAFYFFQSPFKYSGVFYYTTKCLWRRQFTCIDIFKNSKIQQSISLRKFDRLFENSNIQHFKFSKTLIYNNSSFRMLYIRVFENLNCCILEFSNSRSNFRREIDCCILEFLKISMHVTCLLH